ncbi:PadR family transcriptional regulator [Agromyces sp. MMS24-K17]|uniref:PadR family transcriptional regulator n=1 Tax=Agromyces sp. MMS24-K17 TaxID=3372850 RepID=UPI003753F78E
MPEPIQLSPVAVAALALLVEGEMHPYEMYQLMLQRKEDRVVKVSAGTLYRAVERLEQDGLIASRGVERSGNRPERTVYAITDAGLQAMRAAVADRLRRYENEYPQFPLAIGEAHNLPVDQVIALLEERRASLAELRDFVHESLEGIAARGVDRRYVLNVHYWETMLAAEDAWLVELLGELRDGSLAWPDPDSVGATAGH